MRSGLCLVGVAWKVEPRMGLRQLCHTPPDADPLCGALRLDGGGCGTFSSTCGLISLIRLGSQRRARRASAHRKSRGGQFCPLPGRAQSWGSWPRRSAADKCNDDKKASDEEPRRWCDSWVPNRHIGREQCKQLSVLSCMCELCPTRMGVRMEKELSKAMWWECIHPNRPPPIVPLVPAEPPCL